jgi:hypothetical protein
MGARATPGARRIFHDGRHDPDQGCTGWHDTGRVPPDVPAGEHEARITVQPPVRLKPARPFDASRLPTLDLEPWPKGQTLRREEIYVDDGR